MALLYFLQQNIGIELLIIEMLTPFLLELGEAHAAISIDILNLNITNGYYCENHTCITSGWFALSLAAFMPGPSIICAVRGFGRTNKHSATKKWS